MSALLKRSAAVLAAILLVVAPAIGAAAGEPASQHRQIGVTSLSDFKVVVTVTRGPAGSPPMATVSATGYKSTAHGWASIGTRRIGKADQWFWYATAVCAVRVTQYKGEDSTEVRSDTIKVSLLITPALGCSGTFAASW